MVPDKAPIKPNKIEVQQHVSVYGFILIRKFMFAGKCVSIKLYLYVHLYLKEPSLDSLKGLVASANVPQPTEPYCGDLNNCMVVF